MSVNTHGRRLFHGLYSLHLVVLHVEVFNGSRNVLSTQHFYLLCYVNLIIITINCILVRLFSTCVGYLQVKCLVVHSYIDILPHSEGARWRSG
jgi:hypothetical protein